MFGPQKRASSAFQRGQQVRHITQLGDRAVAELGGLEQRVGRSRTTALSLPFCPRFLLLSPLCRDLLIPGALPPAVVAGSPCITSPQSLLGALAPENSVFEKVLSSVLITTVWNRVEDQQIFVG